MTAVGRMLAARVNVRSITNYTLSDDWHRGRAEARTYRACNRIRLVFIHRLISSLGFKSSRHYPYPLLTTTSTRHPPTNPLPPLTVRQALSAACGLKESAHVPYGKASPAPPSGEGAADSVTKPKFFADIDESANEAKTEELKVLL